MDNKVCVKKPNKLNENEDFEKYTKEELIEKMKSITAHNQQLKNIIAKSSLSKEQRQQNNLKPFNFSKCTVKHIALKLYYLGWEHKGYVVQEDTTDTIEHYLFEALLRTRLIKDRQSSNYHRCGRTDKGVSSFGQVISIDVRSALPKGADDLTKEINYCKILNKVLPSSIQCVAWSPVDESFSARFDCKTRSYKYYFPKGSLDIERMKVASEKLLGVHDFRNLCKMDVGNGVTEFTRNILKISIEKRSKDDLENDYTIYVINIKAKAFLWHQIRCIMGILFLIGQRKEEPDVIDELLNVEKNPRKPEYSMASEIPLNLYFCEYDGLNWQYDKEVLDQIIEKLNSIWTFHAIKSEMVKDMVASLETDRKTLSIDCNKEEKCLSTNLFQKPSSKIYIPLMKRHTCDSLEDKIKHFTKRKRIEIVTKAK
nr:tRNA pseudouridine(38/39) synthase [Leptinotarsa decemlineata]